MDQVLAGRGGTEAPGLCQSADVDLDVSTREESGRMVVVAIGEVDIYTAPQLDAELSRLTAEDRTDLVVDLSRVDFLDSTGLSVLVKALKRVREAEGRLDVVVTADRVARVFRITGLDELIPLHASVADALAS
jgi:anti-sigma B factor antagonist